MTDMMLFGFGLFVTLLFVIGAYIFLRLKFEALSKISQGDVKSF